jgi:mannose-6-phosphate isomerase
MHNMRQIPKKRDYPWGYEIEWAHTPHAKAKILHINKTKTYKWVYDQDKAEVVHCLFGSLFIVTFDGEEKIWPGESYTLNSNIKEIKAGQEDAEVLYLVS